MPFFNLKLSIFLKKKKDLNYNFNSYTIFMRTSFYLEYHETLECLIFKINNPINQKSCP